MKKNKCLLLTGLFFIIIQLNAQDSTKHPVQIDKISIGMGGGIDFGGFGYNLLVYPNKNIGLFAGGGYAIAGLGYNVGIKVRCFINKTSSKVTPYMLAMYGYNAAIEVNLDDKYNKLFYGYSVGCGIDFRPNPKKNSYWSFSILIPFRKAELYTYMDYLENHSVTFIMKPPPFLISISTRAIIK